jgi:putative sterol carrier protein
VRFALSGEGGGTWVVRVRDAALAVDGPDADGADAHATIRATAADYLKIANGELSGAEAFSAQKLVIEGDMGRAAELSTLGVM